MISFPVERFRCLRCLNNCIKVPNMIRSLPSGAITSLVAKYGNKNLSLSFEDRFWCSRCLNDHIWVPNIIRSFASGATASLVAKNEQLYSVSLLCSSVPELLHHPGSAYIFWNNRWILTFKVSKRPYRSLLHERIICKWRQCLLGCQKWN